jgi:hypothetical protein
LITEGNLGGYWLVVDGLWLMVYGLWLAANNGEYARRGVITAIIAN